ncbi:MAG: hypothetical protein ABIP28_03455 [Mucilaginibacter sp.]
MNYKTETLSDFTIISDKFLKGSKLNIAFLPENLNEFEDSAKFIYSESTTDIKKAFRLNNISVDYLTCDKPLLRARKSADWFGPTFFIGFSMLAENSTLINISLNVLSNYLYDFFTGNAPSKIVKFEIVVESKKSKEFQKITYEGPVQGINELGVVIKQLKK